MQDNNDSIGQPKGNIQMFQGCESFLACPQISEGVTEDLLQWRAKQQLK